MQKTRNASEDLARDRRKQILAAAAAVFAERGFHRTRVSDIARQAGVAYGLIYHYFDSKDDVLNSLFADNWNVFMKVLRDLQANLGMGTGEKLSAVAALLVDALRVAPQIITVIIQEISRSDRFVHSQKMTAFQEAFGLVRSIIEQGQAANEIKADLDSQVGAYLFFGALEAVCTGATLGAIDCSTDDAAARAKATVTEILLRGMQMRGTKER